MSQDTDTTSVHHRRRQRHSSLLTAFVLAWVLVAGVQFVRDDSRLGWGMFPYVLQTELLDLHYESADGTQRQKVAWRRKPYLPRQLRPDHKPTSSMYGRGAWLDHVRRVLRRFASDGQAPSWAAFVVVTTRMSRTEGPQETLTLREAVVRHE